MSMIQKRLLVTDRVRRPPDEGFSWLDRRFLREFASRLSGDAVFLYLFLAAVSDRQGLSFYSDATLAVRLTQCGLTRHRPPTEMEREAIRQYKIEMEKHLAELRLLDEHGRPRRRSIAVGNRNLGNNHGVVAWQAAETPPLFQLADDLLKHPSYSRLVAWRSGSLAVEDLQFEPDGGDSSEKLSATKRYKKRYKRELLGSP